MKDNKDRTRPFSCGSQYSDWTAYNCWSCEKNYDEDQRKYRCDIEEALGLAEIDDGYIFNNTAERMGFTGIHTYCWRCPEAEYEKE